MSVRIMSLVFENTELSSTEKLVMLALADHANDEGKSIYPSQNRLSRKTGLARPTVNRHIHSLVDKGYLKTVGYREDRANVLELEIIVEMLGGVTLDDTPLSPTVTPPVTHGDTIHHITKNSKHQLKGLTPTGVDPEYVDVGDEFEEPKPSKKQAHNAMFDALADATELDIKLRLNAGRINRASKELREAGYTPKDVYAFKENWKQDWRYKRDKKPPAISIIQAEIKKAERKVPFEELQEQRKREIREELEAQGIDINDYDYLRKD